ncbi:hypothetical protein [Capnocytophaga bilenii]|nr:hypothetical protein [Capnocytophaga bilenii]
MIILEVGYIGLSFAQPSLNLRSTFAQGSVGLVKGSSCPKSFVS